MKEIIMALVLSTASLPVTHGPANPGRQTYEDRIDLLLNCLRPVREVRDGKMVTVMDPSQDLEEEVRDELLQLVTDTPEARPSLIHALMKVLEDPSSELESTFPARWTLAVDLLGELKATQAVDVLIKNIGRTGQTYVVVSSNYRPVAVALAKIGAPAIAPLIATLANPDPWIRVQAAETLSRIGQAAVLPLTDALHIGDADSKGAAGLALAWIGGGAAIKALNDAIAIEKDQEALQKLKEARQEMYRRLGY